MRLPRAQSLALSLFPSSTRQISTSPALHLKFLKKVRLTTAPETADPPPQDSTVLSRLEHAEQDRLEALEASGKPPRALRRERLASRTEVEKLGRLKIKVPPAVPTTAEKPGVDDDYEEATSLEGLEEIGGLDKWWDEQGRSDEGEAETWLFGGKAAHKVTDRDVIVACLRRALIEVLKMGKGRGEEGKGATMVAKWRCGSAEDMRSVLRAEVQVLDDGRAAVDAGSVEVRVARREEEEERELITAEEAKGLVESWGREWLRVKLDLPLAFAINKRLYQLTGTRVPDAKLNEISRVEHILANVVKPPKPATLMDALRKAGELEALPNVTLYDRRVTDADKDEAMGRWKVIKRELEERGLPVTSGEVEAMKGSRLRDWAAGKA